MRAIIRLTFHAHSLDKTLKHIITGVSIRVSNVTYAYPSGQLYVLMYTYFFFLRVIYSGAANLPERVDVEFKSILSKVEPTVLKNIGIENSSYSLIATGEWV